MIRTTGARFVIVAASVLVLSMLPAASPYGFQPIGRNSYQALDSSDIPNSADNGRRSDLNDDAGIRPGLPGDPSLERPKPRTQPVHAGGKNLGIPARLLQAYQGTALRLRFADPACELDWPILAGIGKVESNHAWNGRVDERGTTLQPILGPVLDGTRYAPVPDTDGGSLDGDRRWDRAVGPMQFIPSSWARFAADGNGDGVMSPHNVFDAIYAAGTYLCVGQVDLSKPDALSRAIYRYNHSAPYVQAVFAWIEAYRNGEVRPVNGSTDPVVVADDDRSRPASTPSPAPEPTNPGPRPAPSPAPTDPGPIPTTPGPTPVPTEPTPTPTPSPTPTPGQWCPLEPLPLPLPSVCL
jgi:Transglycosylase SLT domain